MDTIFMNSENSRTSEYYVLVLKLTDKLDLKRGQKSVALSNLSIYYTWKNIKSSYNNNKFKISAQHGLKNKYQIFKIILSIFLKIIAIQHMNFNCQVDQIFKIFTIYGKNHSENAHTIIINSKYLLQHGLMKNYI